MWPCPKRQAIIAECAPPEVLGTAVAANAALEGVFSALFGAAQGLGRTVALHDHSPTVHQIR
jgi:hypothetical protein